MKIYQTLKLTSYLTNGSIIARVRGIARESLDISGAFLTLPIMSGVARTPQSTSKDGSGTVFVGAGICDRVNGVSIYDPELPVSFHCPHCKRSRQLGGGDAEKQTPQDLLPQLLSFKCSGCRTVLKALVAQGHWLKDMSAENLCMCSTELSLLRAVKGSAADIGVWSR